jgi:hypothetical protein
MFLTQDISETFRLEDRIRTNPGKSLGDAEGMKYLLMLG